MSLIVESLLDLALIHSELNELYVETNMGDILKFRKPTKDDSKLSQSQSEMEDSMRRIKESLQRINDLMNSLKSNSPKNDND